MKSPQRARSQRMGPVSGSRLGRFIQERGTNQLLILGFLVIVIIGTLLLRLPIASAGPEPLGWMEALFTSTSAVTVTGLTVVSTAGEISRFGQWVILGLMQVGGAGFVAFSVLAFSLIGRRVSLQERFMVQQTLGRHEMSGVVGLTQYVLAVTIGLESLGAAGLYLRWRGSMPDGQALYYAIFHAISAYCNAGFDLFAASEAGPYFGYGRDPITLGISGALVIVGGLGVTVLYDLWRARFHHELSLHTRLTLLMTLLLTVVGVLVVNLDPNLHRAVGLDASQAEAYVAGAFTAVSARTAGLTVLPLNLLEQSTQLILMVWMFIGAAPASMAGGVSTSTLAVIMVVVLATARGDDQPVAYGRAIPHETLTKAVAVMTVSSVLVATVTLALVRLHSGDIFPVAFEVVSAFSNTGYSLGLTGQLGFLGRLLIALTMFWGRLGPLTVVVALAERAQPNLVHYPEEPIILG
ncbi:MAG: hypothetical protein H6648_00235 [Caldilineae bacterium]|nr:hypothetical protein [Chloroflexota bacterium]MCB9175554.1 hypothetical protein [Caldilineae bacterium]